MITKPDYIMVPRHLIGHKKLTPTDGLVYGVIYWSTKMQAQKCILSNQSIADTLGISKSAVEWGIVRLQRAGFVRSLIDKRTRQRLELRPLVSFQRRYPSDNHQRGGLTTIRHNKKNKNTNKIETNHIKRSKLFSALKAKIGRIT